MGHSRLSPSSAHRWLPCPGSLQHKENGPSSSYAEDGTFKHKVLELVLTGTVPLAGDNLDGRPIEKVTIDQALDIKSFISKWEGVVVETETKVEVGAKWGWEPLDCAGTVDAAAYNPDELLVLDAKFGFVRVEPEDNPQLILYALGLLRELPFDIKHVVLCIAQPNYDGEVEYREHRCTPADLEWWVVEHFSQLQAAHDGDLRLSASDKACRYCPGRLSCAARMQAVEVFAADDWKDTYKLEDLLPMVPMLKSICKDLETTAKAKLSAGEAVKGFKLVESRSIRKWADPAIVEKMFSHIEDLWEKKLKSPAKLEKLVGKAAVAPLAFKPRGAPKLAPESDPRPALEQNTFTPEEIAQLLLEDSTPPGPE